MKIARKKALDLPGTTGQLRIDRDIPHLLRRVRAGDIVVIDHQDLDRATAQHLVQADVVAVVNAGPMISGRFANRGPRTLAEGGVTVVETAGEGLLSLKDGTGARLHEGAVFVGEEQVAVGTELSMADIDEQMARARAGMLSQLSTFTHHTTEFLQHEEPLLLHDQGLPELATRVAGRPVVVVGPGPEATAELKLIKRFVAEQRPVLIGVDRGAEVIRAAGLTPDVVVLGGTDDPATAVLGTARDLVVRVSPGSERSTLEHYERANLRPVSMSSEATPEDLAMLLGLAGEASVIVAAGLDATLEEFLDSGRGGLASTFLTRLKVGPHLVDAQVVPVLYSGRVRARHLFWLVLAGLIALACAFAVATPLGTQWAHDVWTWLQDAADSIQGKFS